MACITRSSAARRHSVLSSKQAALLLTGFAVVINLSRFSSLTTAHARQATFEVSYADIFLNQPNKWPVYRRGKGNYQWVLSPHALRNGLTYEGSNDRLRSALHRWINGDDLHIVTIGGSITAGQGAVDGFSWPMYLKNFLDDHIGPRVKFSNGAVPGTVSGYMSKCVNVHVPKTADVVFVEYNVNDRSLALPLFVNVQRRQYERLLRKLLNYPRRPAVILMHTYSWNIPVKMEEYGLYWITADREFDEFAHYYQLPTLSVKGCCYHLMRQNVTGFKPQPLRQVDPDKLKSEVFYWDKVHPDGQTGTRVMAELAIYLIQHTLRRLQHEPISLADKAVTMLPLPEPMIPNNYQSLADMCFMGEAFTRVVTKKKGFAWVNESKTQRPKWGMVANEPGSVLEITVDTRASANMGSLNTTYTAAAGNMQDFVMEDNTVLATEVLVELAYLRSYEGMGKADVECVSGCTCNKTLLEGHTTDKNSQLHLHKFLVSQDEECVVRVTVRRDSSSPGEGHKVKVAAIVVSEEAGKRAAIVEWATLEYVHDVASVGTDSSQFDIRNHVRRRQLSEQRQSVNQEHGSTYFMEH